MARGDAAPSDASDKEALPPVELALPPVKEAAQELSRAIVNGWSRQLQALDDNLVFRRADYAGILSHQVPEEDEHGALWLPCSTTTDGLGMDDVLRASEGLALLKLLAGLDASLYKWALGTIWPLFQRVASSPPSNSDVALTTSPLGMMIVVGSVQDVEWVSERVVGVEPVSQAYEDAIDAVKTALLGCGQEPSALHLPSSRIPVLVYADGVDDRHHVLRQFLQIVVTQHRLRQVTSDRRDETACLLADSQERTLFEIVWCGVHTSMMEPMKFQELEYVRRIAEHDVRIVRLPPLDLSGGSMHATTKTLHALFPPGIDSCRGVDEIEVSDTSPPETIVAVLSALAACPSTGNVKVSLQVLHTASSRSAIENHRLVWQWIAYALFSRHGTRNTRSLEVYVNDIQDSCSGELGRVKKCRIRFKCSLASCPANTTTK